MKWVNLGSSIEEGSKGLQFWAWKEGRFGILRLVDLQFWGWKKDRQFWVCGSLPSSTTQMRRRRRRPRSLLEE